MDLWRILIETAITVVVMAALAYLYCKYSSPQEQPKEKCPGCGGYFEEGSFILPDLNGGCSNRLIWSDPWQHENDSDQFIDEMEDAKQQRLATRPTNE